MFPNLDIFQTQKDEQKKENLGKTFLVDFKEKKFLKENGKLIKTEDNRSVMMWIEKVLLTKKLKYLIYDEYGMTYYDLLMGHRFPTGFLYAELKREIEETMLLNPKIAEIQNFNAELRHTDLYVFFDVILKNHESFRWEVYL